jgi:hypothetical protein
MKIKSVCVKKDYSRCSRRRETFAELMPDIGFEICT